MGQRDAQGPSRPPSPHPALLHAFVACAGPAAGLLEPGAPAAAPADPLPCTSPCPPLQGVEPAFLEPQHAHQHQGGSSGADAAMTGRLVRGLLGAKAAEGADAGEELARIIASARALVEKDGAAVFESGRRARRMLRAAPWAHAQGSPLGSAASERAGSALGSPTGSLSS